MRSSSESGSAEAALLEKIEQLSFLRSLSDRLAGAPDFAAACRALVDLLWEERRVDAVAYVSVDVQRRLCRVEAVAPSAGTGTNGSAPEPSPELPADAEPFSALLAHPDAVIAAEGPPPAWLTRRKDLSGGRLVSAPTRVRGTTTGLLLVYTTGGAASVEEDRRLLAVMATSAALALAAARSQAREEFLATLRHDINNPLAVALGYSEMIVERLQAVGDAEAVTLGGSVVELLKVIADLVSNYLHMAAIDRGAPSLHYEDLDLGELAAEIVEQLDPSAAEKQVCLRLHGACPSVHGDRRQLGRVIANLVSNAVKYTPGPGRVDVTCASDGAAATVSVADTGLGLTASDLGKLFGKYARFHRATGIPGTGLGLYISKAIVAAHGGTIAVASTPAQGSTFTVRIPHRPAGEGARG